MRLYGDRRWASVLILALCSAPVIAALVVFLLAAARVSDAHRLVDTAAERAARAAAQAASVPTARAAAHQAALDVVSARRLRCAPLDVEVDTTDWGREGTVAVTVTCAADLGSLSPTRIGRSATFRARAMSVIDGQPGRPAPVVTATSAPRA